MDFETLGEHHQARTGILEFLSALPGEVRRHPHLGWATVEEAMEIPPRAPLSVPYTMSWADQNRDLGAWLGNDLQRSAFEAAKKVGVLARQTGDLAILTDWRRLLPSDHFYYMNALTDLRRRALDRLGVPILKCGSSTPAPSGGSNRTVKGLCAPGPPPEWGSSFGAFSGGRLPPYDHPGDG